MKKLKDGFGGQILVPAGDAYDGAHKIWNAMVDKHPSLIARCATVPDVVRMVNFARENGLLGSVRGGGHNIAGNAICDDELMSTSR